MSLHSCQTTDRFGSSRTEVQGVPELCRVEYLHPVTEAHEAERVLLVLGPHKTVLDVLLRSNLLSAAERTVRAQLVAHCS